MNVHRCGALLKGALPLLVALVTACSSVDSARRTSAPTVVRADTPSSIAPSSIAPSAGETSACPVWGSRGFSLVVRAQSSHALFFREFAYDDRTGVVRVHDSDLFAAADGSESSVPRVIQRSVALEGAARDELARELMAMCPASSELEPLEAAGGGTVLAITTATGTRSRVRYAPGAADVARRAHARLARYFPEIRRQ